MKAEAARFLGPIVFGVAVGVVERALLLRSDYRQFPSHPHGRIGYLFLGFVAAILGALAAPSLLVGDYTAGVFLALGTQQFHTVRDMERSMLSALDRSELVPRGAAYIEGMAMAFEARNYLVVATSLAATVAAVNLPLWAAGIPTVAAMLIARQIMRGPNLESLAAVRAAPLTADGAWIQVAGVRVLQTVDERQRQQALKEGLGILISPRDVGARITLAGEGQRQAILHELATRLGTRTADRHDLLLPRATVDAATGAVAVFTLPELRDERAALTVVQKTPVLEATAHRPLPRAWRTQGS